MATLDTIWNVVDFLFKSFILLGIAAIGVCCGITVLMYGACAVIGLWCLACSLAKSAWRRFFPESP